MQVKYIINGICKYTRLYKKYMDMVDRYIQRKPQIYHSNRHRQSPWFANHNRRYGYSIRYCVILSPDIHVFMAITLLLYWFD